MAMTQSMIAIISVGLTLATLFISLVAWLRSDIKQLREDLTTKMDKQGERTDNQSKGIASLAERVARLEGLIEGLFRPHPVIPQNNPDKTESPD